MSSEVDQLMGSWGTVAPGFWDSGEQNGAAAQVQNASVAPVPVPPEIPPEPPEVPAAAPTAAPPAVAAAAPAQPQPAVQTGGEQAPVDPAAGPPPEYAGRVASIFRAIETPSDTAGLAAAGVEAEKLDQEITGRFGEVHSHTISIREIRGWLALETKQPETAVRWYLHTTGLQARLWGPAHEQVVRSAEQAVYAWSVVADPERSRVLGGEVLAVLRHTVGEDHKLTVHVGRLLDRLAAADQRPGPGAHRPADGGS